MTRQFYANFNFGLSLIYTHDTPSVSRQHAYFVFVIFVIRLNCDDINKLVFVPVSLCVSPTEQYVTQMYNFLFFNAKVAA